ncbi:CopL family metal-binding regulatory protein [Marilutibacter spongiae]|uniref:CopL family metal-binding regulatory protein n=1 Tax=Marilutibacter spongiae TaxID=2025720 RepID=A0A7W3TLB2_9GAMM|nr:CopL family metal-binding regulatory protein [Lysobacter spongiae]MBB1060457.1 CopL family metal-binding regulatory protein [Lysobacter spongiae]
MPLRSLALRVLVALLLVLNGAGGAAASVRMAFVHAGIHDTAADAGTGHEATVAIASAPCHDEGTPLPVADADASSLAAHAGHAGGDDCCAGDSCVCACLLHASALPPAVFAAMRPTPGPLRLDRTGEGAPDPLRTQLIRPPIA